jgi:hypothetical protein
LLQWSRWRAGGGVYDITFVQCLSERKALCDPSGSLGLKRYLLVGYDSHVEVFTKGHRCTFR